MPGAQDLSAEQLAEIGRATLEGQRPTGRVILTFEDGTTRAVKAGAFAQISAKRQFGQVVMAAGATETVLWACWVECEGVPAKGSDIVDRFDAWLQTIPGMVFETEAMRAESEAAASADPPPAESSGSSHESPPTSD